MTSAEFRDRLLPRAEAAAIHVSPGLVERLETYFQLLAAWNRRMNLTALDLESLPNEAVDRLFIEPLAAARFAPSHDAVLDIGSGGGSPAIPLALAIDASELTMVESRARKSVFLREAVRAVGLKGAHVVTGRFREIASSTEFTARFAVATVRAVRLETADWVGLKNTLKPGGSIFLFHRAAEQSVPTLGSTPDTHALLSDSMLSIWTTVVAGQS